jgi:hypothetical protein
VKKILRKILNLDLSGDLLSARLEHLQDNEDGTVEETNVTAIGRCQVCNRPIENISDIRGICFYCGRSCCVTCYGACAICKRTICENCRVGFFQSNLSVCLDCRDSLKRRLAYQDKLLQEKTDFERTLQTCNIQIKFIELLQQNTGNTSTFLAQLAEIHVAHKLAKLERRIKEEKNNGKRLLP